MNPIRCVTQTVANVAEASARFETWLDYRVVERGDVSADLAISWLAPESAGAAYVVLQPASGAEVFIRLVEGRPVPDYRPIRTYGWAAIEICVADVEATARLMHGSPFEVIGPPNRIAGLPTIYPMQVRGPDLETLYFTQITTDDPASGLPRARSAFDSVFIVVLACRDMRQTARWFAETFGHAMTEPMAIRYSMIAKAFALPAESLHEIVTASSGGHIFLEFDQYPAEATERPAHPDHLPPGTSLCMIGHPDLARLEVEWIAPPRLREGAIYGGRLSGTVRTPEGALLELVEA